MLKHVVLLIFLVFHCILACPVGSSKYCTTHKNIQPYYTFNKCLIRYSIPGNTFLEIHSCNHLPRKNSQKHTPRKAFLETHSWKPIELMSSSYLGLLLFPQWPALWMTVFLSHGQTLCDTYWHMTSAVVSLLHRIIWLSEVGEGLRKDGDWSMEKVW